MADLIGDRRCLEIAAGDGTLSRFLSQRGVDIVATDDHSWSDTISFPTEVRKLDARRALEEIEAEVVLCSWPPAGNTFERHVFTTPHVNTYVVIGSGSEVSTGDWVTYAQQSGFSMRRDAKLSRRVLPPRAGPCRSRLPARRPSSASSDPIARVGSLSGSQSSVTTRGSLQRHRAGWDITPRTGVRRSSSTVSRSGVVVARRHGGEAVWCRDRQSKSAHRGDLRPSVLLREHVQN